MGRGRLTSHDHMSTCYHPIPRASASVMSFASRPTSWTKMRTPSQARVRGGFGGHSLNGGFSPHFTPQNDTYLVGNMVVGYQHFRKLPFFVSQGLNKTPHIGGHPTKNVNPYYWVDDHPQHKCWFSWIYTVYPDMSMAFVKDLRSKKCGAVGKGPGPNQMLNSWKIQVGYTRFTHPSCLIIRCPCKGNPQP